MMAGADRQTASSSRPSMTGATVARVAVTAVGARPAALATSDVAVPGPSCATTVAGRSATSAQSQAVDDFLADSFVSVANLGFIERLDDFHARMVAGLYDYRR
jgi:hypothetical protein